MLTAQQNNEIHINGVLPRITKAQIRVLSFLHEARLDEWPCIYLNRHKNDVIGVLLRRGWVFCSPANRLDHERYGITDKGVHAIMVYSRGKHYRWHE